MEPQPSGAPADQPFSVLVVGDTYGVPANHGKLIELGKYFDLELATCRREDANHFGLEIGPDEVGNSFKIHRLRRRSADGGGTRSWYEGLRKILRSRSFDLVLCEAEPWSILRWQTALLTRFFSRGTVFAEFTWENVHRTGLRGLVLPYIYRMAARTSDLTIAGNHGARQICEEHRFDPWNVRVLAQLGVDLDLYRPVSTTERNGLRADWGLDSNEFVIGYCGRFVSHKGIDDLAAAVQELRRNNPQKSVVLALMGPGNLDDVLPVELQKTSWIRSFGPCHHEEVVGFLQLLDVFVLASKTAYEGDCPVWEEQFGHVLIEAMACGIPTIGARSGAIPEVLANPRLNFGPGNSKEIAAILQKLLSDPSYRGEVRAEQLLRSEEFSYKNHGRKWAKVLQDAIIWEKRGEKLEPL